MILVEVRTADGRRASITVHPSITVVAGLEPGDRRRWADALAEAIRGEAGGSLAFVVDVDGTQTVLTPEVARSLGVGDAVSAMTVYPHDLPGATTPAPASDAAESRRDPATVEADVAAAEAHLARLRSELADAQRALTEAGDARTTAGRHVDPEAGALVAEAEQRVSTAKARLEEAQGSLTAAEEAAASAASEAARAADEGAGRVTELQAGRARLETERAELVARMVEGGDPGEPEPVEAALVALRRLRSVKPRPSRQATELADRWVEVQARLAALPQPPQPPEWLVTPALAALQEAREALEAAEHAATPESAAPEKIETLDRAHREVLEAEQRAMKKGSRMNRRRLDAAHEAEQVALAALGVASYGEYLQRIAPGADGGGREERLAAARAALVDAEAVWEELHGGQASPEWTAAKEQQVAVRQEATSLLGREVDDDELEVVLREHLETVVETGWAEQELAGALRRAGASVPEGANLEQLAEQWLEQSPPLREARAALEAEVSELDGRLAAVEEQLAEQQADVFFGDDGDGGEAGGGGAAVAPVAPGSAMGSSTGIEQAASAAADALDALRVAEQALGAARQRRDDSDAEVARLADLERDEDDKRVLVDRLAAEVADAEVALAAQRTAAAADDRRVADAAPTSAPGADLSGVIGMEAEAYVLARVAALRGAQGGPLPLLVDAGTVAGLSDGAARRVLRLLGRLGESVQVVVLGDDPKISTWAEGLGDRAAVRSVAR